MAREFANPENLNIAYIGGGSRGWAWSFMADLALEKEIAGTVRLYDIDHEAAKANEKIGNELAKADAASGRWKYETSQSLQEALTDADFVVISILPGTFEEMSSDVHLPEKHGIYQSVGDTAGPGGLVRALRTVPMFEEIAHAIKNFCPKAWVINYTNPMTLCVKALYKVFPDIKAVGCCHEVFGTQKMLAEICQKALGGAEIPREEIMVNVLGINHFTWFSSASYKNHDVFPIYDKFIDEHFESGFAPSEEHWMNSSFNSANRVKFDLFKNFGLIAAAGDRHLAEFMPGVKYLKDPATVKEWKFGLTTVEWRKADLQKRLERSKRLAAGEESLELKASGEEGVLLIKALCGVMRYISNTNLPNSGLQIANLPKEAVVETNAVFSRDSVRPVFAGSLPQNLLGLIKPAIDNHEDILAAALNCEKAPAFKAFMNDPLVRGRLTSGEGERLLDEMIKNTLNYLPKKWQGN